MSYDIRFKVKVEGTDKYVSIGNCDANITWNVRKIIELSTGLPWKNGENNGLCVDVIPRIAAGHAELMWNGYKYHDYESPNGWGTVDGTIRFFRRVLDAWEQFCQWEDEDVVKVTTFWIE